MATLKPVKPTPPPNTDERSALHSLRSWLGRLWRVFRGAMPDIRDAHVYGGGLMLAAGAQFLWPGPIILGALLVYLGLRRK